MSLGTFNSYKTQVAKTHLKLQKSSGETSSLCYSPRLYFQAVEKEKQFPKEFLIISPLVH